MNAPPTTRPTSLVGPAAAGTVIAVLAVLVVYVAARLAGDDLAVRPPGQEVGPVPVAAAIGAAVAAGAAALVLAVLLRRLRRPRRWFLGVTTLALLGSLASPLAAAEATSTGLWLSAMHLCVAAALVPTLTRALPADDR